jgi:DNA repair exonuclease SbcCD ATPase subunit
MAATLEEVIAPAPAVSNNTKHMASQGHSCPECGNQIPLEEDLEEAQRRIQELEAQVELLKEKATAAGAQTSSHIILYV